MMPLSPQMAPKERGNMIGSQEYRDDFYTGAIEALLWSGLWDEDGESVEGGQRMVDQVDSECASSLRSECDEFVTYHLDDLVIQSERYANGSYSPGELAGHDFSLTRNHHGTGFWDRGTGDVGQRLTEACRPYGEVNALLLEDNTIIVE
jgi:hypothetical protein